MCYNAAKYHNLDKNDECKILFSSKKNIITISNNLKQRNLQGGSKFGQKSIKDYFKNIGYKVDNYITDTKYEIQIRKK